MRTLQIILLGTSILATAIGGVSAANAQASPDTGAKNADQIEEIVVTAERRAVPLQKIPVAVTAYSAADLQENDVKTVKDIMLMTPNLQESHQLGGDAGTVEFFLRGFGITRGALGIQPAVGIYIDDFYYPSASGALLRVLDLNSLEVLRGPQGTLFGRNALGGAIRYNTSAPSQDYDGHVELTGGSFNRIDASGSVNFPINDAISVRVSSARFGSDGYITSNLTGKTVANSTDSIGRTQLRFQPSDTLRDDFAIDYSQEYWDGSPYVLAAVDKPPYQSGLVGFYNVFAPPAAQFDSRYVTGCKYCQPGTNSPDFSRTRTYNVRNTLEWQPGDGVTLKLLSSYFFVHNDNRTDLDYTPVLIVENIHAAQNEKSISQELQAQGTLFDSKLHWITGLYFYTYTQDSMRNSGGFSGPGSAFPVGSLPANTPYSTTLNTITTYDYAAYAQINYDLTDQLTATIGGRGSKDDVNVTAQQLPGGVLVPPPASFGDFSPVAKLQYQITPTIMTYASVSKGYRGGTINTVTTLAPSLGLSKVNPDYIWTYEAGARTEFFEKHLRFNATAFTSNYHNIQLLYAYPPLPTNPVPPSIFANGGSAKVRGLEFEGQAVIGDLKLHASAAVLDARYRSLTPPGADPVYGASLPPITLGSHFQHAPNFSYSIGASYYQSTSIGDFNYDLDWAWQAQQYSTAQTADTQLLPSYGLLNLHVGYQVNNNWNVSFGIENLLNKYYYLGGNDLRDALGGSIYEPGAPRSWSLAARYTF